MPWMIPAAIVGGSLISASGAQSAADTQAGATGRSIDEQRRQYDINRADLAPYRAAGTGALANLTAGVGPEGTSGPLTRKFSVADFWNDPAVQLGYQSGLDLGTKALRNRAPLTTGLDSGAALKELTQFGTDYTGRTMAEPAYARFVGDQGNQFGRLAALAGIAQSATNTGVAAGSNTAGNITNLISGLGNAQAGAQIAGANAFGGGLNSIANWWNSQNMLNRLVPPGGGRAWNPYQDYSGGGTGQPNYSPGYY